MKKSLAILGLIASLFPASTAFAAETESNHGSRTAPTTVPDAAPRILELINRERAAAGLTSLTLDEEVTEIALRWSGKMARADRLSHNKAYLSPESLDRLNATTVGENVAFADSVDQIHSLLMESPPHRANILNADFRQVGVGAIRSPAGELYLTEDFLARRAEPDAREERPFGDERGAPAQSAKPPAPRRARPARPAASRPPMGKAARPAAAAPGRVTKPPAPPTATAPLTPSAPPSQAAPPPAASQETLRPVALATPEPAEPTASPEAPSEPEASAEASEPDAFPAATPALEGAADRRGPDRPVGDLVKGLPALVLFRRWLGRRR